MARSRGDHRAPFHELPDDAGAASVCGKDRGTYRTAEDHHRHRHSADPHMRIFAGEVVLADIFTEGRLLLGVGRGNFQYEIERLGIPMAETRERFDESLEVLRALLEREDVSWDGKYYNFDPITVMPRPMNPGGPPMMMAAVNPEAIYHCARQGYLCRQPLLPGGQAS